MTPEQIKERAAPWLSPIPGASPGGEDARYDMEHEALRAEVAKMDSPRGEEIDWDMVVERSGALLKDKSKDVLLACYLCYGLYQQKGIDGLTTGLCALAEMTEAFWDSAWPAAKRERARANSIGWLTDRLCLTLPDTPVGPTDHDLIEGLDAAAKRLAEVVRGRFQEPPAVQPLLDASKRLVMSLPPRPRAAPEAAGAAPAAEAAPQAPAGEPGAAPAAPEAAPPGEAAAPAAAPEEPAGPSPEEQLKERAAPYLTPCPGGEPTGMDARYEIDHEEIRAEVAKLDNPAEGVVEWPTVVEKGTALLRDKSKDLLIASYIAFGLYEDKGLDGLATGIAMLAELIEQYWEGLFPPLKRIRGRASGLSWLVERLEVRLPHAQPTARDRAAVELLDTAAKRLANLVRDKFGDHAPAMRPLTESVERIKLSIPKPAPPRPAAQPGAPAPQAAPAAAPAAPSLAAPTASLGDTAELDKFLRQVGTSLVDAAGRLRTASPPDPSSYRLRRVGLYLHVAAVPPAKGNRTEIPPPAQDLITQLTQLSQHEKWDVLVDTAESSLRRAMFWLDLHRLSAMGLGGLGEDYEAARKAVIAGTADLIQRFPELANMEFSDGTPFASPATRTWLSTDVAGGAGGGGEAAGEEAEAVKEAQSLASGGKGPEAVELLQRTVGSVASGRSRFRARMALAQVFLATGSLATARAVFAGLVEESRARALEEWEPALAADLFSAYLGCLKASLKDAPELKGEVERVLQRLCRVDPAGAMNAAG